MKREVSKRFELSDLEAKMLKMKADQCGLGEADYIRELIMNSQPVEAPPRQFYEQMEKVNRIASRIQRICATAGDKDGIAELKSLYVELIGHIVEIKECVSKARFYALGAYQDWEHQVEMAKKEGKTPPTLREYIPPDHSRDIEEPATDPELGWNALGIRPPFLTGAEVEASDSTDKNIDAGTTGLKGSDAGWQNVDDHQKEQSIESYAESRIYSPPRKEGDP